MSKRNYLSFKVIVYMLIMAFLIGQTCSVSYGEPTNNLNDFLNITKKITREDGISANDCYLGEIINVEYTITSKEVTLNIPKEIAFVIDLTTSMRAVPEGSKDSRLASLKKVLADILNNWNIPNTKICIVEYGPRTEKVTDLLDATKDNINNTFIKTVNSWNEGSLYSGTNLGDGLRAAYHKLLKTGNKSARKYIITLTDGLPNTRTVDKNGNPYFDDADVKNNRLGVKIDPPKITEVLPVEPYVNYACDVMKKITGSGIFTNFLIGFGIESGQASIMNSVGKAGNASAVGDVNGDGTDDYFYRPSNGTELKDVFDAIQKSIVEPFNFTTADFIQDFPDNSLVVADEEFKGIPEKYLELSDKRQISVSPDKLTIPLKLTLKLKDGTFNKYTLYPEEIKFSIKFRVTKTGKVDLPPVTGTYLFHNPVTGEPYTASVCDGIVTINVKQTVNSIVIPPLVIFADDPYPKINAVINPKIGLVIDDNYIKKWAISDTNGDGTQNFSIEDESPKDAYARIVLKDKVPGIAKVTAESSGLGFGAKSSVTGLGNVISLVPQVKNIDMKLGKSKEVSISSLLPESFASEEKKVFYSEVSKIMDTYYKHRYFSDDAIELDTYKNSTYKIYPAGTGNDYMGFNKSTYNSTSNNGTSKITLGNGAMPDFSDGNWSIEPEVSGSTEKYYRIFSVGKVPGHLTSSTEGKSVMVWSKKVESGTDKDLQLWKIDLMEDGNYRIISKKTHKSIIRSGFDISSYYYYGSTNQRWRIEKIEDQNNSASQDRNIQTILKNIEFEEDSSGQPVASADSPKAVKITFGDDHTKLKITGKSPTVLGNKPIGDGKVIITANVIYRNNGSAGREGHISKGVVRFEVSISSEVDIA